MRSFPSTFKDSLFSFYHPPKKKINIILYSSVPSSYSPLLLLFFPLYHSFGGSWTFRVLDFYLYPDPSSLLASVALNLLSDLVTEFFTASPPAPLASHAQSSWYPLPSMGFSMVVSNIPSFSPLQLPLSLWVTSSTITLHWPVF